MLSFCQAYSIKSWRGEEGKGGRGEAGRKEEGRRGKRRGGQRKGGEKGKGKEMKEVLSNGIYIILKRAQNLTSSAMLMIFWPWSGQNIIADTNLSQLSPTGL